jgi:hypothetical protein
LGLPAGAFLDAYQQNREDANALAIESSRVAAEVLAFAEGHAEWSGTATELLEELDDKASDDTKRAKEWPRSGRGLSGKLHRLAPNLRRVGLMVEFAREGRDRARTITLRRNAHDRPDRPQPSAIAVSEGQGPGSADVSGDGADVVDDADGADGSRSTFEEGSPEWYAALRGDPSSRPGPGLFDEPSDRGA